MGNYAANGPDVGREFAISGPNQVKDVPVGHGKNVVGHSSGPIARLT